MMQAVRSSCPPPPACTLRAGSRTAVRSRSPSLRRIRAAASPAESGPGCPPGLSQALENLGEVVRAPHFDRTLAQSLTDVVAAEAALAVTRYEAVKTVARKDVEVACKELEVARKDLEVAEARAAAAGAERLLQELVVDYLRIQGMLHPHGLFEYAEQKLFASLRSPESPQDRLFEWQQLGWLHPGLEACILAANPSWQADLIPAKAEDLASQLSRQADQGYMPTSSRNVLLVEGPLSAEAMRFLKCLADAVHCPCDLWYK